MLGELLDRFYYYLAAQPSPVLYAPRFRETYARQHGIDDFARIDDPVKRLHATFAMSTLLRGRMAVRTLERHATVRGARCLDVGCAYGGFVAAFLEAGAREAIGVDVSDDLLDCARGLLADRGLGGEVHKLDVCAPPPAWLGRFDLVNCNDVIEHVADPALALARLYDLLADGGVLLLEIPNRLSASAVLSDGHFGLFGITVLPRHLADRYHGAVFPGHRHDVNYRSLAFYRHHLRRLGAEVALIDTGAHIHYRAARLATMFDDAERRAADFEAPIPDALRAEVARRVRRLAAAFRAVRARGGDVTLRLGDAFWTLLVRRPAQFAG